MSESAECQQRLGRLDWTPISRGLLLHLNAWVASASDDRASFAESR